MGELGKKGKKQARGHRVKVLSSCSLFLLAHTNTRTRLGDGGVSFLLEFQQVAINLVVYIGVVFLLTQV